MLVVSLPFCPHGSPCPRAGPAGWGQTGEEGGQKPLTGGKPTSMILQVLLPWSRTCVLLRANNRPTLHDPEGLLGSPGPRGTTGRPIPTFLGFLSLLENRAWLAGIPRVFRHASPPPSRLPPATLSPRPLYWGPSLTHV